METGRRLAVGACVVVGVTAYMAYVGASSEWRYYVTVDECMLHAPDLLRDPLRVSGRVAEGSLDVARDRDAATFLLAGRTGTLRVKCQGAIPDNLAEQSEVLVEGWMEDTNTLVGTRVLTRCASKYSSAASATELPRATPE